VYSGALNLHIAALALIISMGIVYLIFVTRPLHKRFSQESRRVAELLSALPPEIEVESLVAQALGTFDPSVAAAAAAAVAGAQGGNKSQRTLHDADSDDGFVGGGENAKSGHTSRKLAV
jgi:hypothetical protein